MPPSGRHKPGFRDGPTSVSDGIERVTKDLNCLMGNYKCTKEVTEKQIWRAAKSTGTELVATNEQSPTGVPA